MKDVHVVVQVFDDLSVVLEEADGHIFVDRQAVRDRLKLPENLVQSALPVFIVPPENTDGGKTDGKVCVRVGGNSLLQESEILLEDRIDLLDGSLVLEKACGRLPVSTTNLDFIYSASLVIHPKNGKHESHHKRHDALESIREYSIFRHPHNTSQT